MKAYKVYEVMGSGYSASFRSGPRGVGNGKNYGLGSLASPYVYSILPLNKSLEPKVESPIYNKQIGIGTKIKGYGLNNNKCYIGNIINIKKDENNEILYYVIKITKTNSLIKIDPSTVINYYDEFETMNKNTYINYLKQQKGEF